MNMRMGRIGLAMMTASIGAMAFGDELGRATESLNALSRTMRLTQPSKHKNKPNKLSQKKRRLNARRLGKFK